MQPQRDDTFFALNKLLIRQIIEAKKDVTSLLNSYFISYPVALSCVLHFHVFTKKKQPLFKLLPLLAAGLLFFSVKSFSQNPWQLRIAPLDTDSIFLKKNLHYKTAHPDSLSVLDELQKIIASQRSQAYAEASFDTIFWQQKTAVAWLHLGPQYRWAALSNGNVEADYLDRSGYRQRLFRQAPLKISEVENLKERLLEQAENSGFPFAKVWLDSVTYQSPITNHQSLIFAQIFLEKGPPVFFDSLSVTGNAKITENYLRSYLGIRKGEPYSRRKVLKIRERLRTLPFLQEKSNATVTFLGSQADIRLALEKKKASRFDFLLGLLPDSGRPDSKLLVTGTFNAEFYNQLGRGERIVAAFERLRPQTQRLEVAAAYPYLLGLPFGLEAKFNQYKRDSTYTDIIGEFGVQYLFEGGNYLKVFWNSATSNLLAVDTAAIRQGRFPAQLDVRSTAFGLETQWLALDYRYNPRRGWAAFVKGSAGRRSIRPNQQILNIAESFYDTLPGRTLRLTGEILLERYFPLLQRSALRLAGRGGGIFSENPVYLNEQYRIGGNRLLRGFDEESIFATLYGVVTLEYRLLIGQNSFFYLFGDYSYVENRRFGQPNGYQHPLGLGGGITFETSAGVFGISLAVGRQAGETLDFRYPKVHFGYVSLF